MCSFDVVDNDKDQTNGYVLFDYKGVEGYNDNNILGQCILKRVPLASRGGVNK